MLKPYQREFIEFALQLNVLRFGEFTLKSGRTSPYFFNAGLFNSGLALAKLGRFYAMAVPAVITSSMINTRPSRGEPTKLPPSRGFVGHSGSGA